MDKILKKIMKRNKYARVASQGLITDVDWYIPTGNYMLNALLSGSIYKGLPGNKIIGFAGEPSSGKTYLTLHIVKNFLEMDENYRVIYIDTEAALDTESLNIVGMDMDKFFHEPIKDLESIRDELAATMADIKEELEKDEDFTKKNKYFFVIDSLGMPPTRAEVENAENAKEVEEMKRGKRTKAIFRVCTNDLALFQYPMIATTHTYDSMQMYQPRGVSGGKGMIFAGTYLVELTVSKDKDKAGNVSGVIVKATLRKSRKSKQYSSVNVLVDFAKGLDKYYGLLDFALKAKILQKDGKKILFPDGERHKKDDILNKPEKFFSKELLDAIDEECKKYFLYGVQLEDEDIESEEEIDVINELKK